MASGYMTVWVFQRKGRKLRFQEEILYKSSCYPPHNQLLTVDNKILYIITTLNVKFGSVVWAEKAPCNWNNV